jgi:hypothetical protein
MNHARGPLPHAVFLLALKVAGAFAVALSLALPQAEAQGVETFQWLVQL